jgi:hypothetical protein
MQPSYWDLCKLQTHTVNQDISVGIATKLRAGLPRNLGSILGKQGFLLSSPFIQIWSVVHPASNWMGTAALSRWVKRPECEADNSPSHTAEGKLMLYLYHPICYHVLYTARFSVGTHFHCWNGGTSIWSAGRRNSRRRSMSGSSRSERHEKNALYWMQKPESKRLISNIK